MPKYDSCPARCVLAEYAVRLADWRMVPKHEGWPKLHPIALQHKYKHAMIKRTFVWTSFCYKERVLQTNTKRNNSAK